MNGLSIDDLFMNIFSLNQRFFVASNHAKVMLFWKISKFHPRIYTLFNKFSP